MIKDKFGNVIEIGDRILFVDSYSRGQFKGLELGTVVGESYSYVRIKPDNISIAERWKCVLNKKTNKYDYTKYIANFIVREKRGGRFLSVKGLK